MENIRILLVDDHPVVRRGLRDLLRSEDGLEPVGDAENGEEAVSMALDLRPDVILMDLIMPKKSGAEAIGEIKARMPKANILILTSFSELPEIKKALRAGALGFVLKMEPPDELVRAIRKTADGIPVFNETLAREMFLLDPSETDEFDGLDKIALTPKDKQVAKLLAQGLSNREIGQIMHLQEASVKVYVTRLMKKLKLDNRTKVALFVINTGLSKTS